MAKIYNYTPEQTPYIFEIDGRIDNLRAIRPDDVECTFLNFSDPTMYHFRAYSPLMMDEVHKVYVAYRQCYSPDNAVNIKLKDRSYPEYKDAIKRHEEFLKGIKLSDIVQPPVPTGGIKDLNDFMREKQAVVFEGGDARSVDRYEGEPYYVVVCEKQSIVAWNEVSIDPNMFELLCLLAGHNNHPFVVMWAKYLLELEYIMEHITHVSASEHMSFSIVFPLLSRACSHQGVRHRISSISQQSQRYTKTDGSQYVTPPSMVADEDASQLMYEFMNIVMHYTEKFKELRDDEGNQRIPNEDIRYIFPNAYGTSMVQTFNTSSLYNFFGHRHCNRAQWEIRGNADALLAKLRKFIPLLFDNAGAGCVRGKCPEGKKTCGSPRK